MSRVTVSVPTSSGRNGARWSTLGSSRAGRTTATCDDEVIPLQARIERVGDDADLEEVYGTERHLLHFACTRVRDRLLVTGVDPGSEFLDDLRGRE